MLETKLLGENKMLTHTKAEVEVRGIDAELALREKLANEQIESIKKQLEKYKKDAESNYQAIPLLHGAGFDVPMHSWSNLSNPFTLDLGEFPQGKPRLMKKFNERFRKARQVLGKLTRTKEKEVYNGRKGLVRIFWQSEDYPSVRVSAVYKLTDTDKCKIVKQRSRSHYTYHSLVCER